MEKSLTIRMEEFRSCVGAAVQQSQLPAAVLELLLYQMYQNAAAVSTEERQAELLAYQRAQAQAEEAKKDADHKDDTGRPVCGRTKAGSTGEQGG